jgi:hypothetical protein
MATIVFKKKQSNDDELESGVFRKPSRVEKKTVFVNGKPVEFPVKVYEPTKVAEPPTLECRPTCSWMDRERKPRLGSGG